jgi:hypothetical protein
VIQFHQLPEHDRSRAIRSAREWREKHRVHVDEITRGGHIYYPPSGSDIFRPELWKPPMWRWLAQQDVRT